MIPLPVTFSWDDGHPLDERLGELMSRHGMRATFYVPMVNREGKPVMSPAAMRALDAEHELGSHTYQHTYLASVSDSQAEEEIRRGKDALEQCVQHPVAGFCYPGGQYNATHRALVERCGFRYARTITNFAARLDGFDAFTVPTTLQFYPHARAVLVKNFVRRGVWPARWRPFAAAVSRADLAQRLRALVGVVAALPGDRHLHLWGHSWELDEIDAWDTLAAFLRYLPAEVPIEPLTNAELARRFARGGDRATS
jgi:hypothetical protein